MEGRMTVCNMTIEGGGRAGMIAPDETTFDWVDGRPRRRTSIPDDWRELQTDDGATFDREVEVDAAAISPMVTLGDQPGAGRRRHRRGARAADRAATSAPCTTWASRRARRSRRSSSTACSSARARTRASATCAPPREIVEGRKVADGVYAMVVPGSQQVKAQAEPRASTRSSRAAGFDWRGAGCSMCLGMNPDIAEPGERCASTSNRNFEGRQGRGARTHLVSPADGRRGRDRGPLRRHPQLGAETA